MAMVGKAQSPMEHREANPSLLEALSPIADQFEIPGPVCWIEPLGEGNVNDTYLVRCQVPGQETMQQFVLQRINTSVFPQPDLVMHNLLALSEHIKGKQIPGSHDPRSEQLGGGAGGRADGEADRWLTPEPLASRRSTDRWIQQDGQFWRLITYVEGAITLQTVKDADQAEQLGRALGRFHHLLSDLPAEGLADPLPGFHVTPGYLQAYHQILEQVKGSLQLELDPTLSTCLRFIEEREHDLDVLETALQRGELVTRVIHGDPKVNNILLCATTGMALAMVDLDTVKPGLLHYDIGDCCRSGCNPAGEETTNLDAVVFDLALCEAILRGYLNATRGTLTSHDYDYLLAAIRLLPLELGLRFLTDHLAGNPYFKVSRAGHNLDRACVQFRLTESIEAQAGQIQAIIDRLRQEMGL